MYFVSVVAGLVAGAVLGGLLGYVVQLATSQAGWALVLGAGGCCLGALWAAMLRANERVLWRPQAASTVDSDPSEP
jgi:hypothetical protein